jgi:flagellar biosynthesis protein FlhG
MIDQAERLRVLARGDVSLPMAVPSGLPRILAVTSGKGGVGKSNISANLGVLLSERGVRTAILDADLGLSNVEVLLGCQARYNLGDVMQAGLPISEAWTEGPAGLKVLSAGSGIDWLANLTARERQRIILALMATDLGIDALIIDTAPGISDNVIDFLRVADEVFVVTTPEPTSVMDSYALIKTMSRARLESRLELIVNASPDRQTAEKTALSIDAICGKFLESSIDAWDWIPYDDNLRSAVTRQRPIVELYPASEMSKRLRIASVDIMSRIHWPRMVASR